MAGCSQVESFFVNVDWGDLLAESRKSTYVYKPYPQAFFCVIFFVATKKMTLLSGNPDGFQLLKDKEKEQQVNDLLL